ncbi:ABC-type antimicrobial peptide transport system, permease component [Cystobacter fuscus DSM 2262]|uniref:ABC-type antimicrobial peptide transport system, permease component n=1 Tax=Cystobacter fuscus (strain ATCC 25194 / DSM 2262 / NBRC 100088 / M29) TaxID=1242864 RepID=S9Q5D3_CYSF2|nr:FtsX-like permease family protein [Cystobacter fuscus]EPX56534.1 ABC-type antimicrobial peptide transport system, permease component [Cystobacter fuscus DSM 2262]
MTFGRLVWKDLLRNPLRLGLTVLAGGVGVMAFIFLRTVVDLFYVGAAAAQADRLFTRSKVSITEDLPLAYLPRIAAVPGVSDVTFYGFFGGRYGESQKDFFGSAFVDPSSFMKVFDEVSVPPEQVAAFTADPCGALIGKDLAARYGWKAGDRVTLKGTIYPGDWTFTVRGVYDVLSGGMDTASFFFGFRCLNEKLPEKRRDRVGAFLLRVEDPSRSALVSSSVDAMFANSPYPTRTESERAATLGFISMLSAIITAVQVVSTVILLIILLVIGNTLAMSVRERTRDLATLRAMGFKSGRVVMLVLFESLVIGLASAALGVLIAPPLIHGFISAVGSQLGVPKDFMRESTLLLGALAALGVSLLAGAIPALRAVRISVAEGLRKVA